MIPEPSAVVSRDICFYQGNISAQAVLQRASAWFEQNPAVGDLGFP